MTFYPDLEPCDYFDRHHPDPTYSQAWSPSLRAVGWLGSKVDSTGSVSSSVRKKLETLAHDPWSPVLFMGGHHCGVCVRKSGEKKLEHLVREFPPAPDSLTEDFIENYGERYAPASTAQGFFNLFVPGAGHVYVAPELILHYIDEHQYQPPRNFCDAVLACPPMGSTEYFESLRRNSSGDFRKHVKPGP